MKEGQCTCKINIVGLTFIRSRESNLEEVLYSVPLALVIKVRRIVGLY